MMRTLSVIFLAVVLLASCMPQRTPEVDPDNSPPTQGTGSTVESVTSAPQSVQTSTPTSSTVTPETAAPSLKPPDAEQPAAGICADPPAGDQVVMTIRSDMPDPRCARARPDQHLKLVNATESPIQVKLGFAEAAVPAGGESVIETALGEYLEAGVHFIEVAPAGAAGELWLLDN